MNKLEKEIIEGLEQTIESRIGSRVGYVESKHPKEVLKGAQIAVRIIKEELIRLHIIR